MSKEPILITRLLDHVAFEPPTAPTHPVGKVHDWVEEKGHMVRREYDFETGDIILPKLSANSIPPPKG